MIRLALPLALAATLFGASIIDSAMGKLAHAQIHHIGCGAC